MRSRKLKVTTPTLATFVLALPLLSVGCQEASAPQKEAENNLFTPLPQSNPNNVLGSGSSNLTVKLDQTSIFPIFCEVLDFDKAADSSTIQGGQDLANVYNEAGVQISVWDHRMRNQGTAIAFDSSAPTVTDFDLGTPNEAFGGPGIGAGLNNDQPRQNLLIKAENTLDLDGDGLIDLPDDDARGGVFVFDFNTPRCMTDISFIDIEQREGPVILRGYDASATRLFEHRANGLGNNSFQHHSFGPTGNTCGITSLHVHLPSSGAIESLRVCDDIALTDISIKDDMLDARSLQVRLGFDAVHQTQGAINLVDTWFKLDPNMLMLPGDLGAFNMVTASVPTGSYSGVQVNILDIAIEHADGTVKSYGLSSGYMINRSFDVQSCRDTTVGLSLDIAPQFIGDQEGLDFRAEPWGPNVSHQAIACAP